MKWLNLRAFSLGSSLRKKRERVAGKTPFGYCETRERFLTGKNKCQGVFASKVLSGHLGKIPNPYIGLGVVEP